MLQLGPQWIELLPGFKVQVKPISRQMMRNASAASTTAGDAAKSADASDADVISASNDAYNLSLAIDGVIDWGGDITDADGKPAAVTPENVTLLMAQVLPASAFDRLYVQPLIAELTAKNASSPSSSGSTATTGEATATDAQSQSDSNTAQEDAPS